MERDFEYVELSNGGFCLVDVEDLPLIDGHTWRWVKWGGQRVYAVTTDEGRQLSMHRLILDAAPGTMVDHANGNSLDNRRFNLRTCTNAQNQQNRRVIVGGLSRFKGVTLHRKTGKWQAQIKVDGKNIYLGLFESELEAAKAYDLAAREWFGEFANPNFADGSEAA